MMALLLRVGRCAEVDQLPAKFAISKAKIVEKDGGLYFHSEHAFLSNFYASPITENEVAYPTAEHYYQAETCRHARDSDRLDRVITAVTPLEAKVVAEQLSDNPEWNKIKHQKMEKTIRIKFEQNEDIREKVVHTKDLALYEATNNVYFEIGATLHSKTLRDKSYIYDIGAQTS